MTITSGQVTGKDPRTLEQKRADSRPQRQEPEPQEMSVERAQELVESLDSGLTLNRYQIEASATAIYPGVGEGTETAFSYLFLKLNGEAGEAAEKYGKILRDKGGRGTEEDRQELLKEVGDVIWYCSQIVNELNSDLETVAQGNLDKLKSRQDRGVLGGSGDNR